jgi:hypothetical protein
MVSKPPPTKTVYELRRDNLNRLTEAPGRKTQLAIRLGVSQARVSHLLNGARRITTDQARELETILGLSSGELDSDQAQPMPPRGGAPDRDLMLAAVRAVGFAATDLGATLPADTIADLVGTVYDLSKPGAILAQPVVKALVQQASGRKP